jgi:hypothetical protein
LSNVTQKEAVAAAARYEAERPDPRHPFHEWWLGRKPVKESGDRQTRCVRLTGLSDDSGVVEPEGCPVAGTPCFLARPAGFEPGTYGCGTVVCQVALGQSIFWAWLSFAIPP